MNDKLNPLFIALFFLTFSSLAFAQTKQVSNVKANFFNPSIQKDSFNIFHYELKIDVALNLQSISGQNTISFQVLKKINRLSLDFVKRMQVDSILLGKEKLVFNRIEDKVWIDFPQYLNEKSLCQITVFFNGTPQEAKNPPWEGGWVRKKDSLGRKWLGTACQGLGASSWWPCKNDLTDEPDSLDMLIKLDSNLVCAANGNLQSIKSCEPDKKEYHWKISTPINVYNVSINAAKYQIIQDTFTDSHQIKTPLSYYVLDYHKVKAQTHFKQVKNILAFFDQYFGHYPFYKDGYKLIETHYWGMEHQSAISYGNDFKNNKWGFDYILLHESAHEYWGNSLTCTDNAELWLHEAFATYTEALYVRHLSGEMKYLAYLNSQKKYISNQFPMVAKYGINFYNPNQTDIYYKGSWFLHTLRNSFAQDSTWFELLKNLCLRYKYQNISTLQLISLISKMQFFDYTAIFKQYLLNTEIPVLRLKFQNEILYYSWDKCNKDFDLPIKLQGFDLVLFPTTKLKKLKIDNFTTNMIPEGLYKIILKK